MSYGGTVLEKTLARYLRQRRTVHSTAPQAHYLERPCPRPWPHRSVIVLSLCVELAHILRYYEVEWVRFIGSGLTHRCVHATPNFWGGPYFVIKT